MTKKYFLLLIAVFLLFRVSAQNQVVSVNENTGTAQVVIPVYSVTRGQVTLPISLVYSGRGVKPKDVESNAGMNWYLQAGGQVSRQLRGLPDDIKKDVSLNTRTGWLYSSNGSTINSLSLSNNGSTCSYETTDISNITTDFGDFSDTEPDIFNVNAPGLSCQLILMPVIPYAPLLTRT